MKLLTIPNQNNLYGNYENMLFFLSLIQLVNYKKLKSIKKRLLVPNYVFFRKFLKTNKIKLSENLYRKYIQINQKQNLFSPGFLLHRRMFFKNTVFLNYLESKNLDYFWWNGFIYNLPLKNKFFFKIEKPFKKYNNSVLILLNDDLGDEFASTNTHLKPLNFSELPVLNTYIFFNMFLINLVEYYKILYYLSFYKLNNVK